MVEAAIQRHGRVSSGMLGADIFPADVAAVLESMSDAFYALDHDWCFTYLNAGAERAWARLRDDLLGLDIRTLFPQLVDSELATALTAALADGQNSQLETTDP